MAHEPELSPEEAALLQEAAERGYTPMAHEPELSPEEAALLQEAAERGYTPKRTVAEPDEAPGGPAGTSNGNED
ncbi:hypothetical protein GCM10023080_067130 [Streptomyces pseudoechinosporeus]